MSFKDALLGCTDAQLDKSMLPLIEKWSDPPTAIQILEVLDKCIFAALSSGLIVRTLQIYYDMALKEEGKTHEDLVQAVTWREPGGM